MPQLHDLLAQLRGHPVLPYITDRQVQVDKLIGDHPDYFVGLSKFLGDKGVLTADELYQVEMGNTGLLLKVTDKLQTIADKTQEGEAYYGLLKFIKSETDGIKSLQDKVDEITQQAIMDWLKMGNTLESFSLETFSWSSEKVSSFTKKELRANDPKKVINLRDVVIKEKLQKLVVKLQPLEELSNAFMATKEKQAVDIFSRLLHQYPQCKVVYDATRLVNEKLVVRDDSGSRFEKDIFSNKLLYDQWYPKLRQRVKVILLGQGYTDQYAETYMDSLKFCANYSFVVKYKTKGKTYYTPAENDLIWYDNSNKIIACGEIKLNPHDIPHADYQHRRNRVMITGDYVDDKYSKNFSDFAVSDMVVDRYISKKHSMDKPVFASSCFGDNVVHFIITTNTGDKPGRLHVPSSIAFSITNWLYSSSIVPQVYIQDKVDDLIGSLCYRRLDEIASDFEIYRLEC